MRIKMTKIKICGLKRDCDVDFVNEACPEYVGFVFAHSRREISAEAAKRLRGRLKKEIRAVGVFVNEEEERIAWLLKEGIIDAVQLHGGEDAAYVARLKEMTGCEVIKALCPGNLAGDEGFRARRKGTDVCEEYIRAGTDYLLFDSIRPMQAGGTGQTFDWSLIPKGNYPFFLAGGLHAGNAAEAIRAVSPYAIDVSSGAETNGVKDKEKILEIVRRVRNE